ncbi:uncharacterized protein [Antedon mediterranea]
MNMIQSGFVDPWATNEKPSVAAEASQWHDVQGKVDTLLRQHETGDKGEDWASEITKLHWISGVERSKCVNRTCAKNFNITRRKHHCRKCGEVFCKSCLRYQRKLSSLAEYDPNGRMYQVCEVCFSSEPQEVGQVRLWKSFFMDLRQASQCRELSSKEIQVGIRKSFQINREINRLICGFKGSLAKDKSLKDKVQGLISKSDTPSWQRAKTWMIKDSRQTCTVQTCKKIFNLANPKHNCRVCGIVTCHSCSSRDLLLFVADQHERDRFGNEPCWAIIKVTGCPSKEPDIHCYLRICNFCKPMLENLQLLEAQKAEQEGLTLESMTKLFTIHENIDKVQSKIDDQLPKYKQLVDGLEITSASPRSLPTNRSNMQSLAKAQGDLMDHFNKFVMCVSCLKQLKPSSNIQVKLASSIMKCKFDFYHENMSSFRKLKKQLEDVAPPEILAGIQDIVDSKTIEIACLSITQVAYETLHLCLKYRLDETLASNIIQTSEVCKMELREHMKKRGENWEQCCQQMELFIKLQLKGNGVEKRQYLRPSRRLVGAHGVTYVTAFLSERVPYIAQQIHLQLSSRSIDRKFTKSKEALSTLRCKLEESQKEGEMLKR